VASGICSFCLHGLVEPYFRKTELIVKPRLIVTKLNDTGGGKSNNLSQTIKGFLVSLVTTRLIFPLIVVSLPFGANAGVFSFVSKILNNNNISVDQAVTANSQTVGLLQAAHNPDPNPAKGGGDITVVGGAALLSETGPSGTIAEIEDNPTNDQISIYVVRSGDTVSGIAKMFGVSVNTVIWANNLPGSTIREGQTLIILPISGVRHVVKAGDTIKSIAKSYKADVDEIVRYNNLDLDLTKLTVGQAVIIPDGEISLVVRTSGSAPTSRLRGAGGPSYEDYYLRPILGGRKSQGLHGYNAVDLATYIGAPVFAAASGEVIVSQDAGWNGGYGHYIVISHPNGTQTLYSHLIQTLVRSGVSVDRGQLIGLVGSTGKSTGPHLHFEVRGAKNPFGE
jgi:LysM repeat protein